jgi:hypothetical protein
MALQPIDRLRWPSTRPAIDRLYSTVYFDWRIAQRNAVVCVSLDKIPHTAIRSVWWKLTDCLSEIVARLRLPWRIKIPLFLEI